MRPESDTEDIDRSLVTRVLVCGSRSWAGWPRSGSYRPSASELWQARVLTGTLTGLLEEIIADFGRMALIHGAARQGADALADHWATQRTSGLLVIEAHPADWARYGRSAGYRRNAEMVATLRPGFDLCLAAWDGQSKGTAHTLRLAEEAGIESLVLGMTAGTLRAAQRLSSASALRATGSRLP